MLLSMVRNSGVAESGGVGLGVSCRVVRLWLGAPEGICACMSDCEN